MTTEKTIGVLLINTGTPSHPTYLGVRRYLQQFLSDRRVLNMSPLARFLLLQLVILPLRSARSAHAYRQIWTKEGSPLRTHHFRLGEGLQAALGPRYKVVCGMRYGEPSLESVWEQLKDVSECVLFPLFPQYAASSTASALAEAMRVMGLHWNVPTVRTIAPFFADHGFIDAFVQQVHARAREVMGTPKHAETMQQDTGTSIKPWEHLVMSFHGLPEDHVEQSGCKRSCLQNTCTTTNTSCYRAQAFQTARLLAQALGLSNDEYSVGFQSRLGSKPWIKPYFDHVLPELRKKGFRRIGVVCPSFVADCLETLEEIQIRARTSWKELGGEELIFVPCLNASDVWVQAAARLVRDAGLGQT